MILAFRLTGCSDEVNWQMIRLHCRLPV